jgi:subtilisin family serine protease
MRKPIALALLCAFIVFGVKAQDNGLDGASRLHPALRAIVASSTEGGMARSLAVLMDTDRYQVVVSPTGEARIGVLAKLADPSVGIEQRGIPVYGRAGSILSLGATVAEIRYLAQDANVVYVEPAWRTEPKLDASLDAISARGVHSGADGVRGEGVVVGIIDTGIDYTHLDFRVDEDDDGQEESSRIHSILDQTRGFLGAEYSRAEIESDLAMGFDGSEGTVRSVDRDGHGTHVASIAAGDGSSSSYAFVGVAPEATIVAVKTTFFTSDILSAVAHVFDEADALGLPAVVNLSLGGHEGPHDGTSLFEEGLDQLASRPGRAIVVSAGNEGDLPIHMAGTLYGTSTSFVVVPMDWELEIGIWYPGSSQFTVTVEGPDGSPISVPTGTETGYVTTASGTVFVDNASGGVNPSNGDHEVFLRLANVTSGDRWRIGVVDEGGGGRFDAWVMTPEGEIEGGDSDSTIDEPGNADRVITVGSFNSKASWPSLSGPQDYSPQYPIGALSRFSSRGPTRDGRVKPDLTAPGAWICAAESADAPSFDYLTHPDGLHAVEIGTSMAAPHVSGAIALLFELDSNLTVFEIRALLTSKATADGSTGTVPNALWGWGKLDVRSAVEMVEPSEPPVTPDVPEVSLERNPVSTEAEFAFRVPEAARAATLRVYTVSGRRVFETSVSPSAEAYRWDLRSSRGETLATGLYFYVLVTDRGTSEVGRLVIAR